MMNAMGAPRFKRLFRRLASERQGQSVRDRTAAEEPHADRRAAQQELGRVRRSLARRSWTSSSRSATAAAGEVCPLWPGQPISAHWGVEDPAAVEGAMTRPGAKLSSRPISRLHNRIQLFLSLPLSKLDRSALTQRLKDIGKS
jgi:hypothetical protein